MTSCLHSQTTLASQPTEGVTSDALTTPRRHTAVQDGRRLVLPLQHSTHCCPDTHFRHENTHLLLKQQACTSASCLLHKQLQGTRDTMAAKQELRSLLESKWCAPHVVCCPCFPGASMKSCHIELAMSPHTFFSHLQQPGNTIMMNNTSQVAVCRGVLWCDVVCCGVLCASGVVCCACVTPRAVFCVRACVAPCTLQQHEACGGVLLRMRGYLT